jgi:NADP-dependent 3-hydroxy acid dehydrogenase YdfG
LLDNKVVLITGATAGIGKSCAKRFAEHNAKLVLVGRREEKLKDVKNELLEMYPELKIHTVGLSVTDREAVAELPDLLPDDFADVSVLVNNAGLALGVTDVASNSVDEALVVMKTNVIGVIAMCSAFVPGMKIRGEGHIINMGSIAGFYAYSNGSTYNASKFAVRGFTEAARHDLVGTPLRVTHISPGLVGNTEFSNIRFHGDDDKAKQVYDDVLALDPDDVADSVVFAAASPKHVQIAEIMLYATNQSGPKDIVRAGADMGGPSSS